MTKMQNTPQDMSAHGVPEVEQERCAGLPLPVGNSVPQCGHFAAHLPHPTGEPIRYRGLADEQPVTPAEQRTGVSDVQHAIADEIAALRRNFGAMPLYDVSQMLARLDRIAARAPQRATDGDGWGLWQHACGHPQSARRGDGICDGCGTYSPDGEAWRALYTVPGR